MSNTKNTQTVIEAEVESAAVTKTVVVVDAETGTSFTYNGVRVDAPIRFCLCGCNLQVVKKAVYRPGHDQRHVSDLVLTTIDTDKRRQRAVIKGSIAAFPTNPLKIKYAVRLGKKDEALGSIALDLLDSMLTSEDDGEE